jgi:hypothetical protein
VAAGTAVSMYFCYNGILLQWHSVVVVWEVATTSIVTRRGAGAWLSTVGGVGLEATWTGLGECGARSVMLMLWRVEIDGWGRMFTS